MTAVGSDPKPEARRKATPEEWTRLRRAKLGPCRGCPSPRLGFPPTTLHHVVSKSLGGDDIEENLIPLCGSGTTGCHGIMETHPTGWQAVAVRIRHRFQPDELRYVLATKGFDFLEETYPL